MKKIRPCIGGSRQKRVRVLLLLAWPPIVVRLLFGAEIGGVGVIMSRLAGIALIGLGVACWPGNSAVQQLYGMLTYSALAMLYLDSHRHPRCTGWAAVVAGGCGPCDPDRSSRKRVVRKNERRPAA